MSSLRVGYGLPSTPAEGLRSRRADAAGGRAGVPRTTTGPAPMPANIRQSSSDAIPRTLSARRTGLPRPPPRQSGSALNPFDSTGRALRHHTRSPPSVASGTLPQPGRNPAAVPSLRHNKPSHSRDAASLPRIPTRKSSSSRRETQGPQESGASAHCVRNLNQSSSAARAPEVGDVRRPAMQPPVIYPELDRYRNLQQPGHSADRHNVEVPHRLATHDISPPTPASILFSGSSSQVSASPSTRLSESPGPGPYSRDTTPTSTCSHSPITAPSRITVSARDQQSVLTRPPLAWRGPGSIPSEADVASGSNPHGLAPVRESVASSSSSSTIRDGDKGLRRDRVADRQPSPLSSSPAPGQISRLSPKRDDAKAVPLAAPRLTRKASSAGRAAPRLENVSPSRTASSPRNGPSPRLNRVGPREPPPQLSRPTPVPQSSVPPLPGLFERRVSEPVTTKSSPASSASLHQTRRNASTPQLPVLRQTVSKTASPLVPAETRRTNSSESSRSNQASTKTSSSFSIRFPFFSRKKAASENVKEEKLEHSPPKRTVRRGPVAGTGHEGYGRFGAIHRRSSSGSSGSRGMAEHQRSGSSYASSDSFLADRVQPVVIAGGEVVENKNAPASSSSFENERALINRRPAAQMAAPEQSALAVNAQRTTLWPSPISHDANAPLSFSHLRDGIDGVIAKPTIAFRRSVQRLRLSADAPLRLPQPIVTDATTSASPAMTSVDASIASEDSRLQLRTESSRGSNDSYLATMKHPKKVQAPRKWNLFGRSHSRPNIKGDDNEVQATVVAVDKKRVAFYAMMDPAEQMGIKPSSFVENLLEHRPSETPLTTTPRPKPPSPVAQDTRREADRPASPPRVAVSPTSPPRDAVHPSSPPRAAAPPSSSGKRGRLPQVGRIPHVVSRRPENSPCPQTFSRPFRNSVQASPRPAFDVYDPRSIATGPTPPKPSTPVPSWTVEEPVADSEPSSSSASKLSSEVARGERQFFTFPSRGFSVRTMDTSSSGSRDICIMADATAVIPKAYDPPDEDEIWDEYNDLLDENSGRMFSTPMTLEERPLRLRSRRSRSTKGASTQSLLPGDRQPSTHSKAPTHSTSGSADMTERIRRAFQPRPTHAAAGASDPSPDEQRDDTRLADAYTPKDRSNRNSSASGRTVFTDCSAVSSEEESPLAQVNLRVGSMTVSKWLSFGHVLFSDIRHELDLAGDALEKHSILVVDGLGNDDWSFYAAETYPAASFYNLSPRTALPAEMRTCPSSFPLSPPNHHQVQYASHLDQFPFAAHSFDGLVYRFPVAAPEAHYRNIVNEARRVLQPGGYMELSVLDADLNSMGNRGRRTVRRLKERIHEEAADVNLASTADLMLRLLGQAGFSSIRAARVGVPVASPVTGARTERKGKPASSLAAMMRDNSPMADESITKLVARVGRWWYTRCYESATGSEADQSIWTNKALVSECEELGTSLKLMVCCARAPSQGPSF